MFCFYCLTIFLAVIGVVGMLAQEIDLDLVPLLPAKFWVVMAQLHIKLFTYF